LDSRLYLPRCWFEPQFQGRRERCRIPKSTAFQTEAQLALELLGPLWKSPSFGGRWITCEGSLANQEGFLEELPKDGYYLAEIADARRVWIKSTQLRQALGTQSCTVGQLLRLGPLLQWQTQFSGQDPILAAWARVRVYLSAQLSPPSEGWVLLCQDPTQQVHFALSNAPEETSLQQLVEVGRAQGSMASAFQQDPSLRGLHPYAHRSWPVWHRHMRLVFLAQLFLLRRQIPSLQNSGAERVARVPPNSFAS